MPNMWSEMEQKFTAGYPYFYLVTHEENRTAAHIKAIAHRMGRTFFKWSAVDGVVPPLMDAQLDPLSALLEYDQSAVLLLADFHRYIGDSINARRFKDMRDRFILQGKTVVVTAPVLTLPHELEKQMTVLEVPLPDPIELTTLFKNMLKRKNMMVTNEQAERFGRAATGLTAEEALLVFSLVALNPEDIKTGNTERVVDEKRRLVESEGVLQFYPRDIQLSDVGGLSSLKEWLSEREASFDEKARAFGLPAPKGLLLLGVQGCGKSLSAKAVAAFWKLPLVQFDLGAAFSSKQGPETSIRHALQLLEAMAPVVVWVDEIEKAFSGTKDGSGDTAIHRIFGHFITWLQEKKAPVFVVATANRVDLLPPELLRKGRFDELFFVDLPDEHEREEILRLHLMRRKPETKSLDLATIIEQTRNYTGAELEQVVVDALYHAFSTSESLSLDHLVHAAKMLVPLYNTYEEDIKNLRDWAQSRTRRASTDRTLADYFERDDRS